MSELGLAAPIKDGKVEYTASSESTAKKTPRGSSELGKDAFLQLLVCQMQNQDPLEPTTDTEFVSQLAQFTQLEELQNLGSESEKAQAFSLVGQHVIFQIKDSSGNTTYPEGDVEYVNMTGGKVNLSVNGTMYSYDDLLEVVDRDYYNAKLASAIQDALEQSGALEGGSQQEE